ncbi:hypothetical protein V5O48_017398 [Marasmius crinis-equi]|uniref:Uncharacterized protein n=1 Tax=Marasmius crinis-equi TaxID=585013 RepID=A0ABR3EP38_9AGAR
MMYAQHTRTQMLPAGTHAAKIREQQRQRQASPNPPTDDVQQDEGVQMPPAETYAEKERQREASPHPPPLLVDISEPPSQPREPELPEADEQRPSTPTPGPDPADGDDIAVLRAQLSAVMMRVAMLEANERVQAEDPPDYVSSYEPS